MLSVITKIKIEGPESLVEQALDDIVAQCIPTFTTIETPPIKTPTGRNILISYAAEKVIWSGIIKDISKKYPDLKFESWVYISDGPLTSAWVDYTWNGVTYSSYEKEIQTVPKNTIKQELFI